MYKSSSSTYMVIYIEKYKNGHLSMHEFALWTTNMFLPCFCFNNIMTISYKIYIFEFDSFWKGGLHNGWNLLKRLKPLWN